MTMDVSKLIPTSSKNIDVIALGEWLQKDKSNISNPANAESLVSITDGVRMFNITSDGTVSTPCDSTPLHIVKFKDMAHTSDLSKGELPVFLHAGDWVYPLIPGVSPVLRSQSAAYILPDFLGAETDSFVGLIFPEKVSLEVRQKFEDTVKSFGVLLKQDIEHHFPFDEPTLMKEVRSKSLAAVDLLPKEALDAAKLVAYGMEKEAKKVEKTIKDKSKQLMQSNLVKDPTIQKGVTYAKEVSDSAVKVSDDVVKTLGKVTVELGKALGPHIKHGKEVLRHSLDLGSDYSTSKVDKRFLDIYASLVAAAKILDRYITSEEVL